MAQIQELTQAAWNISHLSAIVWLPPPSPPSPYYYMSQNVVEILHEQTNLFSLPEAEWK